MTVLGLLLFHIKTMTPRTGKASLKTGQKADSENHYTNHIMRPFSLTNFTDVGIHSVKGSSDNKG